MTDFLLWAFDNGITIGYVAFGLAVLIVLPLAVLSALARATIFGGKVIAAGWVWAQFFRWLRDRSAGFPGAGDEAPHHRRGGAGGRGGYPYSHEYTTFMASEDWRRQRARVLRRDGHRCQQCGGRGGLEAHHVAYSSPIRDTPDWGVTTLCRACHQQAHGR